MKAHTPENEDDPLRPHAHEPNPEPPTVVTDIILSLPDGTRRTLTLADLYALPETAVPNCFIVSTGHGTSGPFTFSGPPLLSLVRHYEPGLWTQVEVISADGFGTRATYAELVEPDPDGPILLAYAIDGAPLTRAQGLVRLIVPSEHDDALRQVKWVEQINVR